MIYSLELKITFFVECPLLNQFSYILHNVYFSMRQHKEGWISWRGVLRK